MKEYIPVIPTHDANFLKVEVYYSLGGISYATYRSEPRGYYLSVSPVNRNEKDGVTCESFICFTGVKKLILPCGRRSEKRMEQAIVESKEHREELIQHVLRENRLQLLGSLQEVG